MQYLGLFLFGGLFVTLTFGADFLGQPDEVPGVNHDLDYEWKVYVKTYNKTYEDKAEAEYRRFIWEDNLAIITKHNKEAAEGKHTYFMGVNAFTDWTFSEFSSRYLTKSRKIDTSKMDVDYGFGLDFESSTDTKNWTAEGAVTPVKDQGRCGSCWAFSTTGSVEGQVVLQLKRDLVSLSEQMLIDCCTRCSGCQGGLMTLAFECIKQKGGIDTEVSYPYKARDGICTFKPLSVAAKVERYKKGSGEPYLHSVVQQIGPASVSMFATKHLQLYKSGIFSDVTCNTGHINHGVLVVGYGDGYWLVKNSWGTRWGMGGYFKIKRGYISPRYGMCMIAADVSYPILF